MEEEVWAKRSGLPRAHISSCRPHLGTPEPINTCAGLSRLLPASVLLRADLSGSVHIPMPMGQASWGGGACTHRLSQGWEELWFRQGDVYTSFVITLAQWLSWLKHCPIHQNVVVSISWSGHIPRLQVHSLVGACVGGNQSMLLSHINVSLSLSLFPLSSFPPSLLFPSSLPTINKHVLGWNLKKEILNIIYYLGPTMQLFEGAWSLYPVEDLQQHLTPIGFGGPNANVFPWWYVCIYLVGEDRLGGPCQPI